MVALRVPTFEIPTHRYFLIESKSALLTWVIFNTHAVSTHGIIKKS